MVRVRLATDCVPAAASSVVVALQDPYCFDCTTIDALVAETEPPPSPILYPILTVKKRTRVDIDDDGTPIFDWETILEAGAMMFEERTQLDDVAGITQIVAHATMLYEGEEFPTETAVVMSSLGAVYEILRIELGFGVLVMDLLRIEDVDAGS